MYVYIYIFIHPNCGESNGKENHMDTALNMYIYIYVRLYQDYVSCSLNS